MRTILTLVFSLAATAALAGDWWGERPDSGTQYFYTNTVNQSGVGVAPASETIRVYKNGGGDGELLTTGASIDDDFESATAGTDALAGLHQVAIDTTQSGFDAGSYYTVVYVTGTSDSVSVISRVIGTFRLVAAESTTGYPNVTIKDGTGTGELDTASGGVLVGSMAANSITSSAVATGAIDSTALAANAIAVGTIEDGAITAGTIAADAIGSSEMASDAIGALEIATNAIDADAIAASSIVAGTDITGLLTAANVNTEIDTALADIRLDELLSNDSDIDGAAPPTDGSVVHEMLSKTGTGFTYDQTTDSLQAIRDYITDTVYAGLPTALVVQQIDDYFTASRAEPAQGTPAASTTFLAKLDYLYKFARNKKDNTGTAINYYNDDATTVDHKATVGTSGGTTTVGETASGP